VTSFLFRSEYLLSVDFIFALLYVNNRLRIYLAMKALFYTTGYVILLLLLTQCAGLVDEMRIRKDKNTLINPSIQELEALERKEGYVENGALSEESSSWEQPLYQDDVIAYDEKKEVNKTNQRRSQPKKQLPPKPHKPQLSQNEVERQLNQYDKKVENRWLRKFKKPKPEILQKPSVPAPAPIAAATQPAIKPTPAKSSQKNKKPLLERVWHRIHHQPKPLLPATTTEYDPALLKELRR